jgi:hypothetical protein
MGLGLKAVAAVTALFLAGTAAGAASAQARVDGPRKSGLAADDARWGIPSSKESIQWTDKGRWGVNVDVDQPVGRDVKLKDVEAGAFFRIAPSLKVGGAVRLGDKLANPERVMPEDRAAPRVRLETKFRF